MKKLLGILISASALTYSSADQGTPAPYIQTDCAKANHKEALRQNEHTDQKLANHTAQASVASSSDLTSSLVSPPQKAVEKPLASKQPITLVNTDNEKKEQGKDADNHEAAIAEIDKCLDKASAKAKELAEVIRSAKKEQLAAKNEAQKANDQLSEVRTKMDQVKKELAAMQERDGKNTKELQTLQSKLAESAKATEQESQKLLAAATNLSAWETRAKRAESDLQRTKQAMETTLQVANEAKALGSRYQEKLTLGATQLAERESTLSSTLTALKRAQESASACQARVTALQAELDQQKKQFETTVAALRKAESERDSYRTSKLAAENSLTKLKGELTAMKGKADQLPGMQTKLAELEATLKTKQQNEAQQAQVAEHLTKTSDQMKTRLDEILIERETLHDNLTLLRNEFAQFRITAKTDQDRIAKESVNQLQTSLARENAQHQNELAQRDQRLAQLEKSLQEKEQALQATYKREKEATANLSNSSKTLEAEINARKALTQALEQLRIDLEASQKKACQLKEQLVELESISLEN